jgi:hypothetical protein
MDFSHEDGGCTPLRNVDVCFQVHTALKPEDQHLYLRRFEISDVTVVRLFNDSEELMLGPVWRRMIWGMIMNNGGYGFEGRRL